MITVIFGAIISLDDGSGRAINYVLAAIVVSGILQVLLGLLKLGRIAEIFPSSVIHGILAAIGVIIFAKQMHVAIGTSSDAGNAVGILKDLVDQLPNANPYIALISITGIFLMFFHSTHRGSLDRRHAPREDLRFPYPGYHTILAHCNRRALQQYSPFSRPPQ